MSQVERVEAALMKGQALTAKQIAARFRIASPRKVVSRVRARGHNVVLSEKTDTKGRVTRKYQMA